MIKKNTYQFTKYFIYILLVGQLWSNVFSYVDFYFDDTDDLIELTSSENDSEKEKENKTESKKDFEDKIVFSLFVAPIYKTTLSDNFIHKEDLLPINHLEINTPPPKFLFFIS